MSDVLVNMQPASLGTPAFLDLQLSPSGDLQLTTGVDAIRQAVTLRLLASVEDYFLDMDAGVPWHASLFSGRQGLTSAFEAVLQNTILATPGVFGLISWAATYDRANRSLLVKFEAQCDGGTVAFSVPVAAAGV